MSSNCLEILSWDSNLLGFKVAHLLLANTDAKLLAQQVKRGVENQIKLLYLTIEPEDEVSNKAALQSGAILVDRKVTFGLVVPPQEAKTELPTTIHSTTIFTERLNSLVLQSGVYSRYRLDPNFAPDVYPRLYQQWLNNSLSGELAHKVLIYEPIPGNAALGMLTLGMKNGRADIGLLAVDASTRGVGVGQSLVLAARHYAAEWKMSELQVVTQLENVLACKFYRKCGFEQWHVEYVYHLWLI